jgi:release factor glutamine methyltransferase
MAGEPLAPVATVASALADATRRLLGPSDSPRLDAEILLAHALGWPRARLYARPGAPLPFPLHRRFLDLLERRAAGEPVAYLTGHQEFWSLSLSVTAAVLVPRPETELLVEVALERVPATGAWQLADLGTGSGAVALALARERPLAGVLATDRSAAALAVARENCRRLGLAGVAFARIHWCAALAGAAFDLIAANPPYVARSDPHLRRGGLVHEPRVALDGGQDGLDAIRAIAGEARRCLRASGWLLLEHGWDQGPAVRGLLRALGYAEVASRRDLAGTERVTLARAGPLPPDA